MRAMILPRVVALDATAAPLELVDLPIPVQGPGELLIRVAACGVCHTELDEIEGRTAPPRLPVVLGHEIVGYVEQRGEDVSRHEAGARVGVGWIHSSTGNADENLSPRFRATGRDVDGGYAEYVTVPQDYAYPVPEGFSDSEAAPLLCAGAIGFRAVRLAQLPEAAALGLMGFGGSAHLVLQVAKYLDRATRIFVFARDSQTRDFALQLGATWAGDIADRSPELLDAIIDTTPAWKPVVESLANLRPGGRLVINAIRKEDEDKSSLLQLSYHEHLWMEREIKTVANITQHDIREFLPLAAEIPLRPRVTTYRLEDANRALLELKQGRVQGAKVLVMDTNKVFSKDTRTSNTE